MVTGYFAGNGYIYSLNQIVVLAIYVNIGLLFLPKLSGLSATKNRVT